MAHSNDAEELNRDKTVIDAATAGPWIAENVDDPLCMNAWVIRRQDGTGELEDHTNNVAIVLLQEPRYADIGDEKWDENAAFIARSRTRWPWVLEQYVQSVKRIAELEKEITALRDQKT